MPKNINYLKETKVNDEVNNTVDLLIAATVFGIVIKIADTDISWSMLATSVLSQ